MCSFVRIHRLLFLLFLCLLSACSSAPKRVMLVSDVTNAAYSQLDEANKRIIEGNYVRAYNLLTGAYKRALSVDNAGLLCKISLSGVVLKISNPSLPEGNPDAEEEDDGFPSGSFLDLPVESIMSQAEKFARRSDSSERAFLESLCLVYEVRMLLESERASSGDGVVSNPSSYLSKLDSVKKTVSKEPYYYAHLWRTQGDVFMASGRYLDAQKSFAEAAKIHTKERYLVEIGLDWYCIARSYSMAGRKSDALLAIQTALKYDRDAENSTGIAADYKAYAKILLKGTPSEEDKKLAEELDAWSEKILEARM